MPTRAAPARGRAQDLRTSGNGTFDRCHAGLAHEGLEEAELEIWGHLLEQLPRPGREQEATQPFVRFMCSRREAILFEQLADYVPLCFVEDHQAIRPIRLDHVH